MFGNDCVNAIVAFISDLCVEFFCCLLSCSKYMNIPYNAGYMQVIYPGMQIRLRTVTRSGFIPMHYLCLTCRSKSPPVRPYGRAGKNCYELIN